ncbi:DMT family transporter [Marinomonas fungiae]|uniref:Threonine/homoserine efflux transporter RhtA n=1 Tax=Marinomonas fungiae TaxID=1137284 RepID=A0A0K6ILU6_9GAMM|nr:DMT family transporter [Marinomonas fungiae]CUB04292.1 Threonine/homoserine efflux transporter RhtA [Marinomonas fungiae]
MTTLINTPYRPLFGWTECMLLLVAIFWGTSYGLTKDALMYVGVFTFIGIRFGLTFLMLLPVLVRDFKQGKNQDWLRALPTGLVLSGIFVCEVSGVLYTSATNAAVLISLSMILTALAETLINRSRVPSSLWLMGMLSCVGVLLLSLHSGFKISFNLGDGLILLAAMGRAIMVTLTKRLTHNRSITMLSLTAIQSLVVTIMAIIVGWFSHEPIAWSSFTQPAFWLISLYLVLMCTLFAFFAQNLAISRTSPTRVALLMGSEPLFGALFAMLWLGESLSLIQWLGALLIIASVMRVSTSR